MKQLTTLYVESNALKDVSVVAYLPCLDTLDVSDNFGVIIEPLSDKTKMIYLFLKSINLRDIYALRNMINLKLLDLSHNYLIDISVLQQFQSLESLDLSFNKIKDFKVFQSGIHVEKQDFCYLLTDQSEPNIVDLLILQKIQHINNQTGSIIQLNKRYTCLKKQFESKLELVQNQIEIAGKIQSSFMLEVANLMNIICDEVQRNQ
ncbi:leucine-rich_repeat domain-containing protein [Hexamita inflata]|uniref:Leucine-rich repeat domain-containing protein n=1 Tax=Hexamita inflata TaxID=28002 RepID=A0AA86Q209_9EUKA|nr:leucine-rich repeat domain-containing protein [Hexamita inflata]